MKIIKIEDFVNCILFAVIVVLGVIVMMMH